MRQKPQPTAITDDRYEFTAYIAEIAKRMETPEAVAKIETAKHVLAEFVEMCRKQERGPKLNLCGFFKRAQAVGSNENHGWMAVEVFLREHPTWTVARHTSVQHGRQLYLVDLPAMEEKTRKREAYYATF